MNFQIESLWPWAISLGLILLRTGAMFILIPTLGSDVIPARFRAALSIFLALAMLPIVGQMTRFEPVWICIAAVGELIIGLCLGVVVRLMLSAAELAGELMGLQMGLSFSQIVDPLTHESGAETTRLLGVISTLIFITIDGHHMMIHGLAESLRAAPVGAGLPSMMGLDTLLPLLSTTFLVAIRIAAPVIFALLLTNCALGLLSRAVPQLNIFSLSFGVTIGMGVFIFTTSLPPSLRLYVDELRHLPEFITHVVGG